MRKVSAVELYQKLKAEWEASQDNSAENNLRIRILDYLIDCRVPDNRLEEVLEGRINDPDPAKETSKIICSEILNAWRSRTS
ncbi:MAG: hypothetical protein JXA17_06745 [Dehalococcoidales bacterium]|nr:hypothetical protein [Dehalococcoidales bacterium]